MLPTCNFSAHKISAQHKSIYDNLIKAMKCEVEWIGLMRWNSADLIARELKICVVKHNKFVFNPIHFTVRFYFCSFWRIGLRRWKQTVIASCNVEQRLMRLSRFPFELFHVRCIISLQSIWTGRSFDVDHARIWCTTFIHLPHFCPLHNAQSS